MIHEGEALDQLHQYVIMLTAADAAAASTKARVCLALLHSSSDKHGIKQGECRSSTSDHCTGPMNMLAAREYRLAGVSVAFVCILPAWTAADAPIAM